MTLKNFLAELSFVQLKEIKRHAKGLLLALENSNRKEMLDYEVKQKETNVLDKEPCEKCHDTQYYYDEKTKMMKLCENH